MPPLVTLPLMVSTPEALSVELPWTAFHAASVPPLRTAMLLFTSPAVAKVAPFSTVTVALLPLTPSVAPVETSVVPPCRTVSPV